MKSLLQHIKYPNLTAHNLVEVYQQPESRDNSISTGWSALQNNKLLIKYGTTQS